MNVNYIEANKYAEVTHRTADNLITIITGWGIKKEALFRKGLLTLETEAKYARVQYLAGAYDKYTNEDVIKLSKLMLEEAQKVLNQHVSLDLIEAAMSKIADTATPVEAPKPPKVSKAQHEKNELAAKIIAANADEKVALVNSYGVFKCVKNASDRIAVSTYHVLALANYKRCTKMAGETYLKKIEYIAELSDENIFELVDISIKTNKTGQAKLSASKAQRIAKRHNPFSRSTSRSTDNRSNWQKWFDDADMPEKINGVWVDLETGF